MLQSSHRDSYFDNCLVNREGLEKKRKERKKMTKLSGIKVITTKAGNKGYEYHFIDEFSEYDREHAECYGNQVYSEYSSKAFQVKVGDEVTLIYGKGFQGKAQLIDMYSVSENKLKISK